jgi:hypothetical protein
VREVSRRDGCVALCGEDGDPDMVVVEPAVISFAPVRGNSGCVCGAPIEPWGWRCGS